MTSFPTNTISAELVGKRGGITKTLLLCPLAQHSTRHSILSDLE